MTAIVCAYASLAQNNVYGKKVVGLDSLVSDTIRARTQAAPYIEGFGTGVGGSNTEIQFNDNGSFGASSSLTWDGDTLTVDGIDFTGSTMTFTSGLPIFNSTLGGGFSFSSNGSAVLLYNSGQWAWDFENTSIDDVNDGNFTIVNAGNLNLNGNTISSSTGDIDFNANDLTDIGTTDTDSLYVSGNADVDGTLDVGSTATFAGEVTVEGGVIDLSNGGTNGKSALNSSLGRSQIYVSNDNTGAAPFDQKGSIIIQPRSDAAGRSVAIATGSVGSEAVAVLVQGNQNTEFSGNIIASSGEILHGNTTPALTISGGSTTSLGGQIQLNGEGASAASDIIFKASGTEVGRWDESASQWKFLNSLDVSGALSKGSGTFKITHPLDTSKWLYHSFVEAPRADNIYRGKVELYQGAAMVGIDTASNMTIGTFDSLNHNVQVFISNNDTWDLVKGSYSNGVLSIESQNVLSHAVVDWLVIGERKDQTVIDWDLTDENGHLIPEHDKE